MATKNLLATASVIIEASPAKVWKALIDPAKIKEYMFGATVKSDWKPGSGITWEGEMNGKDYKDKGEIVTYAENENLAYSHYSPLSGVPDVPESYHTVDIKLKPDFDNTEVTLTQDNNPTGAAVKESTKNWTAMLEGLKKVVEENS